MNVLRLSQEPKNFIQLARSGTSQGDRTRAQLNSNLNFSVKNGKVQERPGTTMKVA